MAHGRFLIHCTFSVLGFVTRIKSLNPATTHNLLDNSRGTMTLTARGVLRARWFGVMISLLTLGTVMPSTAQAGCLTHYITYRSQVNGELPPIDLLGLSGTLPASEVETPPATPAPAPCTGALCSGNPATPFSTPPLAVPPWVGQWAIPGFSIDLANLEPLRLRSTDVIPRPVKQADLIFHPPRPLAPCQFSV